MAVIKLATESPARTPRPSRFGLSLVVLVSGLGINWVSFILRGTMIAITVETLQRCVRQILYIMHHSMARAFKKPLSVAEHSVVGLGSYCFTLQLIRVADRLLENFVGKYLCSPLDIRSRLPWYRSFHICLKPTATTTN